MADILALDIATTTGWARRVNGQTESGRWNFSMYEDYAERGFALQNRITDAIFPMVDGRLYMERSFMGYLLHGLSFSAHMAGYQLGMPRFEVTPLNLKLFTTGHRYATKAQMMAAVRKWGFDPVDDNEADALALLTYAIEEDGL